MIVSWLKDALDLSELRSLTLAAISSRPKNKMSSRHFERIKRVLLDRQKSHSEWKRGITPPLPRFRLLQADAGYRGHLVNPRVEVVEDDPGHHRDNDRGASSSKKYLPTASQQISIRGVSVGMGTHSQGDCPLAYNGVRRAECPVASAGSLHLIPPGRCRGTRRTSRRRVGGGFDGNGAEGVGEGHAVSPRHTP